LKGHIIARIAQSFFINTTCLSESGFAVELARDNTTFEGLRKSRGLPNNNE